MTLSQGISNRLKNRRYRTGPYTPPDGKNLPQELLRIEFSETNQNGQPATRKVNGEPQRVAYIRFVFRELENAKGNQLHEWSPPAIWLYLGDNEYDPDSSDPKIAGTAKQIAFQEETLLRWIYFFAQADQDESPLSDPLETLTDVLIPDVNARSEGEHPTFTVNIETRKSGQYTNTYINPVELLNA